MLPYLWLCFGILVIVCCTKQSDEFQTQFLDKINGASAVEIRTNTAGIRGLFVTESHQSGDVILSVPVSLFYSPSANTCTDFRQKLQDHMKGKDPYEEDEEAFLCLVAQLAKDLHPLLHLNTDSDGCDGSTCSSFLPYLRLLPYQSGCSTAACINPNVIIQKGYKLNGEYITIMGDAKTSLLRLKKIAHKEEMEETQKSFKFDMNSDRSKALEVAMHLATSRSENLSVFFSTTEDAQPANHVRGLIPVLDMVNHNDHPNVQLQPAKDHQNMLLVALKDVQAGQELLMDYFDAEELPEKWRSDPVMHLLMFGAVLEQLSDG
eukprot:TRINITY_DN11917_c0_g1_i1.p1 TRINITY_DN11917_c0_g1~~TRINITY_DN11917_c0_g1_i1.p1  ORF type:complete len:320 (+),score=32.91 TRINITY_DN11917_c0_g1_i1:43-1002(+)